MNRIEYYREPDGPRATRVAAAVFGVIRDIDHAILMVRRADNGNWEPPGGHIDPGESPSQALVREALEECGITVKVTAVAGVYSDPDLVLEYPDLDEVRQQFAVYFHADYIGGVPRADGIESADARWVSREGLMELPVHPVVRRRLQQVMQDPGKTHID